MELKLSRTLTKATKKFKPPDNWTKKDTQKQLVFAAMQAVDWVQTRQNVGKGYYEKNPILGRKPSKQKIDALVLSAIIGHYLVSKNLSPKKRKLFQNISLALEAKAVGHNYSVGAKINF